MEDELYLRDEELFFRIVQTTPDLWEAEDMLRRARQAAIRLKETIPGGRADQKLGRLIPRINDEIHYITEEAQRTRMSHAIYTVLGREAQQQVLDWIAAERPRRPFVEI